MCRDHRERAFGARTAAFPPEALSEAPTAFTPPEYRIDGREEDAVTRWIQYATAKGPMLPCCGAQCTEPFDAVSQRYHGIDAQALREMVHQRQQQPQRGQEIGNQPSTSLKKPTVRNLYEDTVLNDAAAVLVRPGVL